MYGSIDLLRAGSHLVHASGYLLGYFLKVLTFVYNLIGTFEHFMGTALHMAGYFVNIANALKYLLGSLALFFHRVADVLFLIRYDPYACINSFKLAQYVFCRFGDLVN